MARIRPELALLLAGCGEPEAPTPAPACDATWESFGEAWFRSWCTACHSSALPEADRYGAPPGVDFDTLEGVRSHAARIEAVATATGVPPRMPPGGGPTASDRAELAAWLACGLPGDGEESEPGCDAAVPLAGDLRLATAVDVAAACAGGPVEVAGSLTVSAQADLPCLCAVGGDLVAEAEVTAPALERVGGDLVIGLRTSRVVVPELRELRGGVRLPAGAALGELDARSLESVGGDWAASDALDLLSWRTASLREVGGDFRLERLPGLVEVDLSRLGSVGGDLVVDDLPAVRVLQGEGYALRAVGGDLVLRGMPAWAGFYGFGQLEEVEGDLVIAANGGLTHLDGFTALRSVGGSLSLTDHDGLMRLDGFDQLERVGGDLVIARNAALASEDAFAMLETIGGTARLEENPALVVRDALTRIIDLGGLVVDGLPSTRALALPALARCEGDLVLRRSGVTGFGRPPGLWAVGGDLVVVENPRLADLSGWPSLAAVGGDLVVTDNPALAAAEAEAVATGVGAVGGAVDVRDNGP